MPNWIEEAPFNMSEQQHVRDLRERLNSRRQQKVRQLSLRSRSRSSEDNDSEIQGRRWPADVGRERRVRRDSRSSWPSGSVSSSSPSAGRSSRTRFERETDPVILARRQKQLDYGRNTLCYQEYTKAVPKHKREAFHPRTPIKSRRTSRRRWDCAIKNWRIHLHYWNDPVKLAELRRRNSDSDWSESESTGAASAASTPEPRRSRERRAERKDVVKQEPDVTAVKQEPPEPDVKQEPIESTTPAARRQIPLEAASVTVKQEPMSPDLTAIKQRRQDCPEPAVVKQECPGQEAEQMQSQLMVTPKQEPADPDDDYDPSLSWADDVEGLAEELAG